MEKEAKVVIEPPKHSNRWTLTDLCCFEGDRAAFTSLSVTDDLLSAQDFSCVVDFFKPSDIKLLRPHF